MWYSHNSATFWEPCQEWRFVIITDFTPLFISPGSFSVFKYLIGVMLRVRRGQDDDDEAPKGHPLQSLITCFLCGWFITGAYKDKIIF